MSLGSKPISSFSKIIIFIVIGIIGISLIPSLSVRLKPNQNIPVITISYNWPDANPRILESSVTNKIEQSLSSISELINISSITTKGLGKVRLEFAENANLDKKTLYISSILRQIYSDFPKNVTYPTITKLGIDNEHSEELMTLSISGKGNKEILFEKAESTIRSKISKIKGISNVELFGIPKKKYLIVCDNSKIEKYNIDIEIIKSTIATFYKKNNLGLITLDGRKVSVDVEFNQTNNKIEDLLKISIFNKNNDIVNLKDIISIKLTEEIVSGYKRFNGNNALTIYIQSEKDANQLNLVKKLSSTIEQLNHSLFKDDIQINVLYDSTLKLKEELFKVIYRVLFSLGILFLFVLLVSRSYKYILLIFISLVLNLLLAIIFYNLFSIDIHLYSLAGFTISLGIIIDNTIIMIDHLINKNNKRVIISILAATLTTVGALSIIFFIKKEYQLYLFDFSWIIIINLLSSLLITFYLIPSLSEKFKYYKKRKTINFKRKTLWFSKKYYNILKVLLLRKKIIFVFFFLLFGLPFFMIPNKVPEDYKFALGINKILENEFYKEKIAPNLKYLGGTMYSFIKNTEKGSFINTPERVSLKIRLFNTEGGTIEQLNNATLKFENFLDSYQGIDIFLTEIYDTNNAIIRIFFNEEIENTDIPYSIKNKLESIATQIGGLDCSIYGVGQPFSNTGNLISDATIKMKGYNLDDLLELSSFVKNEVLLQHPRIINVKINSEQSWILKDKYEYALSLNDKKPISKLGLNSDDFIKKIIWDSGNESSISSLNNIQIIFTEKENKSTPWELQRNIIKVDSVNYLMGQLITINKENVPKNIVKKNNEYEVFLDYSFAGTFQYNNIVYKELINTINTQLPIGYEAIHPDKDYVFKENKFFVVKILLIIFLIIYIVCTILFESFTQPLAVILTIPTSFIGIFLTFSLFDIPFDQGGLASFIMLSGIVVNSSIYIINQYNNLAKKNKSSLDRYLKAFNLKIAPVLLTIFSTILGLLPFILVKKDDFFWTSFAYGNIGGLLFSIIIILFFLPLCLNLKTIRID